MTSCSTVIAGFLWKTLYVEVMKNKPQIQIFVRKKGYFHFWQIDMIAQGMIRSKVSVWFVSDQGLISHLTMRGHPDRHAG